LLFQESIGIDLRPDCISLAYLKGSMRGIKLVGHAVVQLEQNLSEAQRTMRIAGIYADFTAANRVGSPKIFMCAPREMFFFREIEFPAAVKENISSTLRYEMEKYIPLPPDDILFDFQVVNGHEKKEFFKILLVVAKKKDLAPYIALKDQLQNGLGGIEPWSTAAMNCLTDMAQIKTSSQFAAVYLGPSHLEIDLLSNKLPIFSKFISLESKESEGQAAQLEKELRALSEGTAADSPEGMIYLWGDAGSGKVFDRLPQMPHLMLLSDAVPESELHSLSLTAAYGLALKGQGKAGIQINLLPSKERQKQSNAGLYALFILVGLFILSGLFWGGSLLLNQRVQLERLSSEMTTLKPQVRETQDNQKDLMEIVDQISYLNSLSNKRTQVEDVLKELTVLLPDSVWVKSMNLSGDAVKIQGEAQSASDLIPLLEASPIFTNARFLSTITKIKNGQESFSIGFDIVGGSK
jgi:Tfp pilus assembly protein PilN